MTAMFKHSNSYLLQWWHTTGETGAATGNRIEMFSIIHIFSYLLAWG